eukprot:scaffold112510_cov65-Cyclotella_meneghiniana.AAC.2
MKSSWVFVPPIRPAILTNGDGLDLSCFPPVTRVRRRRRWRTKCENNVTRENEGREKRSYLTRCEFRGHSVFAPQTLA